ncbi:MAG: Gfo/Idh/MocA family oxidoreductase [Thermoflexales bacterium]|nr:Gfo/Idh/MocA family oxidoreductase [Thermoflexales bacterium]
MGKEIRVPTYASNPRFGYLPEKDHYLFAREKPRHAFNVIGIGVNGQEQMLVTLLEGRATINGVYDPNPRSVERARAIMAQYAPGQTLGVYDTLEAACADPAADGIIIATPNHTHIDVLRAAVKSGKHILLEKPMATTLADAWEMVQMSHRYSSVLQVGLQYRFKPVYVEAVHEALHRRTLGDIKTITILEHRMPFLDKVGQWNKFSKFSGGTLVEKCCHYFDLFNLFAQARPTRVFASGSQAVNFKGFEYNGEKSDILDNAFVDVAYQNGVRANFNLCMFAPMVYEELILCGDEGRLKAWENEEFVEFRRTNAQLEIMAGENRPSKVMTPAYPELISRTGHHGGTFYERAAFIDAIEGRQTTAASVAEGFWSVVIGIAAERSVKTGQPVEIPALLREAGIDPVEAEAIK